MSVDGCLDLFQDVETSQRLALLNSHYGDLLPNEIVVDLFCGAGGWGEGAKKLGIAVNAAINHWERAITTHAANNPECEHHLGDAWRARPLSITRRRIIGLLLASAACTSHSNAKGDIPISPRIHMLGICILRWVRDCLPRVVLIENVAEWRNWGPLIQRLVKAGYEWDVIDDKGKAVGKLHGPSCRTPDGARWRRQHKAKGVTVRPRLYPDPTRKGQHFKSFIRRLRKQGYQVEFRVLDAPDYGAASRRRRLFVIARRDGQPIVWPKVTHGISNVSEEGRISACGQDFSPSGDMGVQGRGRVDVDNGVGIPLRSRRRASGRKVAQAGSALAPYRTAADIIDWSDLGRSIIDRPQPLKEKTHLRIIEGIRRVLKDPEPFVLRTTHGLGGGWHVSEIDRPGPTQTTRQDLAFVTPVTLGAGGSGYAGKPTRVDRPENTVLCDSRRAITSPIMLPAGGPKRGVQPIDSTFPAVLTREAMAFAAPITINYRGTSDAAVNRSASPVTDPAMAITGSGTHHYVLSLLMEYYGNSVALRRPDQPLGVATTKDRHGAVNVVMSTAEFALERARKVAQFLRQHLGDEIQICPETGVAFCVVYGQRRFFADILFRMFRVPELARAMGFPPEYQWPRSQRDATKMIGNAVEVHQAEALIGAVFPRRRLSRKAVAV